MTIDYKKIQKVGSRYYLLPKHKGEPMLALNETCKIVIEALGENKSLEDIVHLLASDYMVDKEEVDKDVRQLVEQLRSLGILN